MNRFFAFTVLFVLLGILNGSSAQPSAACSVCMNLMAFAEPLAPTMGELDLQVVMHAFCNQQANLQDPCKNLVDRFMHALYPFLKAQAPPAILCQTIQVCSSP